MVQDAEKYKAEDEEVRPPLDISIKTCIHPSLSLQGSTGAEAERRPVLVFCSPCKPSYREWVKARPGLA